MGKLKDMYTTREIVNAIMYRDKEERMVKMNTSTCDYFSGTVFIMDHDDQSDGIYGWRVYLDDQLHAEGLEWSEEEAIQKVRVALFGEQEEPPLQEGSAVEDLGTNPSKSNKPTAEPHKEVEGWRGQHSALAPEEQPVELCRCCALRPAEAKAGTMEERAHCWTCNQDLS